tara:strand:+ start:8611 stop:9564 length:954 start_codon:yes stop_codon:yes gene_type:complete
MTLSIVIPLLNEAESLPQLHEWIIKAMEQETYEYEVLYIDDGSTDKSWNIISELAEAHTEVKGISFARNYGKSQALHAGFSAAQGDYVATLDADLQDSPEELQTMMNRLTEEQLDLISGWKKVRHDAVLSKNIPSKIFNWAARKVSKIELHDFNCGIKLYQSSVVKSIDLHGDMHRYIPVLAAQQGFSKIGEQVVQHQARQFGKTKFGSERFFKGFLDLITLWFLNAFGKRPMHFFGLWGTLMLTGGFFFTLYLGIDKLFFVTTGRLITQRPEFYIALICVVLGSQFFIAGFLGELILRQNNKTSRYIISKKTKSYD